MPILTLSIKDIEKLISKKLPRTEDALNDFFQYVGGEVETLEGDDLQLEIKCRNRPDLWSVEGIVRELKGAHGKKLGLAKYKTKKSNYVVEVDKKLIKARPYIACAVVKGVKLSDEIIKQLMQQQEKVDGNYGRARKRTSIGLYNADLITFPLRYMVTKPYENPFIPLDFDKPLPPQKILAQHPKGREYAHLVENLSEYPIFLDKKNKVLSMPPIINSDDLGKIQEKDKNILVEVTGTSQEAVHNVLTIMTLSLADRGGEIYEVKVKYTYKTPFGKDVITPNLKKHTSKGVWEIKFTDINKRLGTNLKPIQIKKLLEKARHKVELKKNHAKITIPIYRTDVMHPVDLIEDIAIMYGYNEFEPLPLDIATTGGLSPLHAYSDKVRNLLLGFGLQEIQTFTLGNPETFSQKVRRTPELVTLNNPMSSTYSALRDVLYPSILDFLSKNTTKEYPQRIYEVGDVVVSNKKSQTRSDTIRKAIVALTDKNTNFTEIKSFLTTLFVNQGLDVSTKAFKHEAFIEGRAAKVVFKGKEIGFIGEVHPEILNNFGLTVPVTFFEIDLNKVLELSA